jgi:hypothetical protein
MEAGRLPPKIGRIPAVRVSMPDLEDLLFGNASDEIRDASRPAEVSSFALFFITPSRCPVPSKCRQASNTKEDFSKLKKANLGALLKTLGTRPLGQSLTVL